MLTSFKNLWLNPKLPSDRNFGWFFTILCSMTLFWFLFKGMSKTGLTVIGITLIGSFSLTLLAPQFFRQLNKAWYFIGLLLGILVSPLVLGILYFCLISPIGIFRKLFGSDELQIRKRRAQTFWNKIQTVDRRKTYMFNKMF